MHGGAGRGSGLSGSAQKGGKRPAVFSILTTLQAIRREVLLEMFWKRWTVVGIAAASLGWAATAHAKDLKVTLPKRSHLTAVQRLNQEGVQEIHKRRYE